MNLKLKIPMNIKMLWVVARAFAVVSFSQSKEKGCFDAGVTCVGMGSKLMAKHADGSFDYAKIEAQTRNALKIISSLR